EDSLSLVRGVIRLQACQSALILLNDLPNEFRKQAYFAAKGDVMECLSKHSNAILYWQESLKMHPAYARDRRELERKIGK
ncbi:hypothetical protein, partial [Henriciella marina]